MSGFSKNRRTFPRRIPRGKVQVTCHEGFFDLGPNLALSLLDVSEDGICLILKTPLEKGKEVTLSLQGMGHSRPKKMGGTVVWSNSDGNNAFQVGIRLNKRLPYAEIINLT